ncbi:MAG TPA: M15 family metallopeptidase, partial [Ornithinibacter sp.]|nr:M15 family metallopeptidase [Ornithinibacter sp.]
VVGDTGAVSEDVAKAARALAPRVVRVDHGDPVDAARALTRAAFPSAATAWVASARRTTDLATAAAAAAARRSPLLVLDEEARSLGSADATLLDDLGVTEVTVVGGTGDVAPGVETGLARALGPATVERVAADDRAGLAARVHAAAWDGATPAAAYVANPDRSTDTFTGAFLAGRAGVPLLWTLPYCLPSSSRTAAVAPTVSRVTVIGGERSVRSSVDALEKCRSIEDPSSTWVLVNKRNGLSPKRFVPPDLTVPAMDHAGGHRLRSDAAKALAEMASASVDAGAGRVGIDTAFRSFETQEALYAETLARRGRAWTDTWYLRPGFSEHQTGLTVDLLPVGRSDCTINDCIDETPQGAWLARNAWRFGYLLRYERGETSTTGVGFEPWHFRYVGTNLARAYHEGGWDTYEEFLGEPAAPTY